MTHGDTVQRPLLSVLIPSFNWPAGRLAASLVADIVANDLQREVDIHFFDDASAAPFAGELAAQPAFAARHGVRLAVHRVATNAGRAAARNELLARSQGSFVLFLDADVLPDGPQFLPCYLNLVRQGHEVVCGGISYEQCTSIPARHRFYHRYSSAASVAAPTVRNVCSWAWIFTANMLVSRRLVASVPFDPGFVGYGYEDIEWGIRLHKRSPILHVDNTVTHLGLLDKAVLQRKLRESAANIVHMTGLHPALVRQMKLVRAARAISHVPAPMLKIAARAASALYRADWLGFKIEWIGLQAEKVFLTALAFRAANASVAADAA